MSKLKNKKLIMLLLLVAIVVIVFVTFILLTKSYKKKAINMVENDLGNSINATDVYYNKKENGCIVYYSRDGLDNIACVHLNTNKIGYKRKYEMMLGDTENNSYSDNSQQEMAKRAYDYPYNIFWIYNQSTVGEQSGWIKQ